MKVLFTGDRNWTNRKVVIDILTKLKNKYKDDLCICEGGAKGLDTIVGEESQNIGIYCFVCNALWDYYRKVGNYKAAGVLRNQAMLLWFQPEIVIGFHDNINESKGTKDCLNRAIKNGIKAILVNSIGENKIYK